MTRKVAKLRLAYACSTAMIGLAMVAPAQAQTSEEATQSDSIIVTGSRIVRRDYEANSPIVTVGDELLRATGSASLETSLNRLPAFTAAQNPSLGRDTQASATNTPGAATVSLRGLGTNRNLVLVDGRRATPANALGVVDINTIPAAAIDRIEVITGGASATYGADAVGGVVNFILKRNFEGFAFDGQAGITQRGDGFQYALSSLIGTNFADGDGNVTLGISKSVRRAAREDERSWFQDAWEDPRFAGTQIWSDFSAFSAIDGFNPSQASYDALFGAGRVNASGNNRVYFNPDGTAFTGMFGSQTGGSSRFNQTSDNGRYKRTQDGGLAQNFQDGYAQLPLSRYNIYGRADFALSDWIQVFTQATFTRSSAETVNEPSPTVNGWSGFARANAPVPAELRAILNSRVIPTTAAAAARRNFLNCDPAAIAGAPGSGASCDWQLTYLLDFANRVSETEVTNFNVVAGFEGEIPGTDWTWDIHTSKGESSVNTLLTGTASLSRFRAIINSPNWGAGFRAQGNQTSGFGGFGAATATCTSGFNPFNFNQVISQDCIEAISADIQTRSFMEQSVYEANAQGGLFELPAGQVRASVGATHRSNDYRFTNDTLTSQGRTFLDQPIGLFPSGNSEGTIRVNEVYGELLIPILSGVTFFENLELNLGGRYSDFNTTGGNTTWKAMVDWEVNDFLRLRGGYNKAVRAPNIAELFLAPQQTFSVAGGGDVCRNTNTLAWSVNPAFNPNHANVRAVCRAVMDVAPGTADIFYGSGGFGTQGGPSFAFPSVVGNPNIQPETARTWTVGAVINAPFAGEVFDRLRLTVDYYNIAVDDAIGPLTVDTAMRLCFDPTFNPLISTNAAAAAATTQCQAVERVAGTGALGNVQTTYLNNGRFRTQGIDLQLDWTAPVGPGELSINSVFNYLITFKSAPLPIEAGPAGQLVEYAGTLGPAGSAGLAENGLNPGAFRWKMFSTVGYSFGPADISLQWQHLPSARSIASPSNPNTPFVGSPAYNLFNLNGSVRLNDVITLRGGIENLFDKAPPVSEFNAVTTGLATAIGTSPINGYFFDVIGRRFYVGASVQF